MPPRSCRAGFLSLSPSSSALGLQRKLVDIATGQQGTGLLDLWCQQSRPSMCLYPCLVDPVLMTKRAEPLPPGPEVGGKRVHTVLVGGDITERHCKSKVSESQGLGRECSCLGRDIVT